MRLDPQLTEKLQQRNEQQPSLVVERKRQPRASAPQELSDEHLEGVIGGTGVTMVGPAGLGVTSLLGTCTVLKWSLQPTYVDINHFTIPK
ncbi:MAG TPA: hypothetical protein VKZ52_09480 [Burkholderiaceae bacterium]|nr:hypothetical protein [Burkholderiaceae bacterium]